MRSASIRLLALAFVPLLVQPANGQEPEGQHDEDERAFTCSHWG